MIGPFIRVLPGVAIIFPQTMLTCEAQLVSPEVRVFIDSAA
jgi:hypothetical protein